MRLIALAVVALSIGLPAGQAAPATFFRTPSKNIYCANFGSLRCDIGSGLKPRPAKPASCDFDWGQTYTLGRSGRARIGCVSDSVFASNARVLAYGTSYTRGGITCVSKVSGLRCTNASGHGFFMSRAHSFRF